MAGKNILEEKIRLYVESSGDKELGQLAAQLTKLSQGSDVAAQEAAGLVAELDKLATTSSNIRQFTALKASLADTAAELGKAKERMAALAVEADRADKPTAKLQASLKRAADEVQNLTRQQNQQQVALQRTSGALRSAGVDTDQLATAYGDLQDEFGAFSSRAGTAADAMRRTAKDSKAAASGVSALDKAATVGKKSLTAIAAQLTAVSGAALVAVKGLAAISGASLFSGALRSATTLEEALSQVKAVSGATADEMVRLKEAAETGGAATKFSTLDAAQGLGELARATGDATSAIEALPSALNLAQAASISVADAATIITTTLTQYGLAADQAGRVSDVLAKEVNSTTDSMSQLGNALSYAAPLANQLGLDLEDTAAIIGVLADEGFRGERAGTALRNVFTELQDPASDFSRALRDMGIGSTDFATVIDALARSGSRGREALLKLDAAARPAISALVEKGSAKLGELETALRSASGEAERSAAVMGQNLAGAAERVADTFDRTRRSLVEPLLEPLRAELAVLATELETFAQSSEFEEIKTALTGLFTEGAAAARDMVQNVDFSELATKIKTAIGDASATVTEFKENLSTIVDAVVMVGNGFSLVFNAIQTAILLLAAAVAKIVSLVAKIGDGFTEPQRKLLQFYGVIGEGQTALGEFAGGMAAVSDEFGGRFASNLGEAIAAAQALADNSEGAGDAAAAAVTEAGGAAQGAAAAFEALTPAVAGATAALTEQGSAAADSAATTAAAAGSFEISAERLQKAFADMGIASQVDLQRAAEAAKSNFSLIRDAVREGQATAEDARRAFARYAEAARAAVADSNTSAKQRVDAELALQEAVLGVSVSLDDMGARGAQAGRQVAGGAEVARESLQRVATSTKEVARGAEAAAGSMNQAGSSAKMVGDAANRSSVQLGSMTDELTAAYLATNRYVNSVDTGIWRAAFNNVTQAWREQSQALQQLNGDYDEQLAKLDPLTGKLEKLRQAYPYLQEAQLRATAEKQQRLEDETERKRDETQRLLEEAQRQVDAQRDAGAGAAAALAKPINDTLTIDWKAPSRSTATSASATEIEQAERIADLVAPRVLQRIERSRSLAVRRRPGR